MNDTRQHDDLSQWTDDHVFDEGRPIEIHHRQ
jgi:hypothetical protein